MMNKRVRRGLAYAVCCALLMAGCSGKSTRTILLDTPRDSGAQAEQTGTAGDIKEIHSIKLLATLDEENIELFAQGWMDDTHLCAMAQREAQPEPMFLISVDDTYGFVKKLEGTEGGGEYTLSPDGKNVAYIVQNEDSAGGNQDGQQAAVESLVPAGFQSVCLYQTERAEVMHLYENRKGHSLSMETLRFSTSGRYVSFVEQDRANGEMFVHVYDLHTDAHNTYNATYLGDVMFTPRWVEVDAQGRPAYALGYDGVNGICCWRLFTDETNRETYLEQMLATGLDFALYANLGDDLLYVNRYGELTCLSLATDQEQMLLRNVLGMVASGTGKRVAYTRMNGNNMELYVADLQESQARNGGLTIANARVVYTGMNLTLLAWNPAGNKLLILDQDKEDSRSSYRVLEFYTAE